MPSWKKVVASGSDASFSSATVDTFVSASSFKGSFTGSLFGTASQAISSSYALTASYLLGYISPFPFTGSAEITGSLGVTGSINSTGNITTAGTITAQTLVVTTVSSSVIYSSGSNRFGDDVSDQQTFTGSVNISGSLSLVGRGTINDLTGSLFGTASWATNFVTGSVTSASYAFTASSAISSSYALTASYLLGYISPFPFTGSAQITGSLGVTGSFSVTGNTGASVFSSNADTLLITGSLIITGSGASITGSLNVSNGITGSLFGTASQAISSSYAYTASSAISASFAVNYLGSGSISTRLTNLETASGSFSTRVTNTETTASNLVAASASFSTRITNDSSSLSARETRTEATASNLVAASASFSTRTTSLEGASGSFSTRVTQIERTYATTGSNIFTGSQNILGAITASAALINGTLTAQTLVVTTVSSSVIYSSGSNRFGDDTSDIQTFTGSVNISGSLTLVGRGTINDLTGSLFGTASWATNFITGSVTSASYAYTASSATNAFQAVSASFAFTASSAVRASASLIATSASYAFTASSAILASASLVATSASYAFTASSAISSSYALTASYLLGYISPFPFTGSAQITGSLGVTGSLSVSAGITGSLFGTASQATSASYAFTASSAISSSYAFTASSAINAFSSSFALTASFVNPLRQNVIISGSLTVSASATALSIQGSGSNVFSVDGTSGRLFEVDDSLSGSLFSVNTAAGLPVIEAFSDNTVRIGQFGQRALFVSQSRVGVGTETPTTNLDVSGSGRYTNGLSLTGSVNSLNGYTGSLFGTASWAQNFITGSVTSASYAYTASSASTAFSASYAQTSSFANNFTVANQLTAQTLIVSTISSSVVYSSGSNIFGNSTSNTQTMTGSLNVSGSATIIGRVTATNLTGSLFGTASQALTASYSLNAANAFIQNGNSFGAQAVLGTNDLQNLALETNGSTRLFISSSGAYVGVGITTPLATVPQALLDVNGIIHARGGIQTIGNSPTIAISASRTDNTFPGTLLFSGWGDYAFNNSLLVGYNSTTLGPAGLGQGNLFVSNKIAIGKTGSSAAFDVNGSAIITGSLIVLSGITGSLSGSITGSLFGTASQATSASYAFTASSAISSSFALTASYLLGYASSFPYTGSAQITGSLGVTGSFSVSAGAGSSVFSSNADTLLITGSLIITGSGASITGSLNVSNGITGSLFGTASQATSASYAFTASSASTAFSASFAATSSFANNFTVANTLTAQTIVVSTISSSVVYSSGSNIFGNSLSNTQTFTGSVGITGSLTLRGNQLISGSLIFTTASTYTPSYDLEIPQSAKNNGIAQIYGAGTTWTFSAIATISRNGTGNQSMLTMLMGGTSSTIKQVPLAITGSWNQSGTAGYTILEVAAIENTIGTGPKLLQDWVVNGVSKASINNVGTLRLSGSANITGSLSISGSLLLNQSTSSLGISTQTVSTNATSSYTSVFYNYTLASGSNARAGQVIAVWSGSAIQYMDNSTTDIGNTSLVALTASLSAGNVLLTTVLPTAGWTVKTLVNLL